MKHWTFEYTNIFNYDFYKLYVYTSGSRDLESYGNIAESSSRVNLRSSRTAFSTFFTMSSFPTPQIVMYIFTAIFKLPTPLVHTGTIHMAFIILSFGVMLVSKKYLDFFKSFSTLLNNRLKQNETFKKFGFMIYQLSI